MLGVPLGLSPPPLARLGTTQYAVAKCESGEYLTKRHQGLSTALNAIGCSTLFLHTSDLLLTGTHL